MLNVDSKDLLERKLEDSPSFSVSNSPTQNSRPSSMVVKKAHTIIPAHLIAEAIPTIHGLDLRCKPGYPKRLGAGEPTPFIHSRSDIDETQLKASRLLDILKKKTTFQGNFISTPEIQAQNRALKHCGLSEADYLGYFQR
ncbi:hypothetical protein OIU84_023744 [Salix udensis]|uniref:Uncharacterized protein n=1 Tax=Salix udensis TaxID=889485 RepID=A0AAD6KRI2_9ROSI|nr:hypothetical protein OIU84_023744 [Salix udensis]